MLTIPSKEELRAAAISHELHRDEQQAEKIRRLVIQELRQTINQIHDWAIDNLDSERSTVSKVNIAIEGAIADAMATGLEIGLLIREGRQHEEFPIPPTAGTRSSRPGGQ